MRCEHVLALLSTAPTAAAVHRCACCAGVLLPSTLGFVALVLLPLSLWFGAVAAGLLAFDGLPEKRSDVSEPP